MQSENQILGTKTITLLALGLALAASAPSARANVYASNIKINGTLRGSASVVLGAGATISYILNEPASAGVTIKISSGNTVIRTISVAGGSAGTTRGLNTVVWDGKNDANANVPIGSYTVTITAGSAGYDVWTQIGTNASPKLFWPSGIAVDTSTNSPYYGRVMVANGVNTAQNVAPHRVGILKFNANGTEADEGQSNAGNPFRTDSYLGDSISALKYGTDDRVYFNDWVGAGKITACDMIMSTNQLVLDADSFFGTASAGNFPDMDVTDPGTTNALGWMADGNYPSVGIWCWPLTNNGAADPAFAGINVVATGGNDIPLRSGFGLKIDEAGDIFIGEVRSNPGDTSPKVICITNWHSAPSLPIVNENLAWQAGALVDDTFLNVADVSIDSRAKPKLVSAAFSNGAGGMKVLNAADGTLVTNLNQGVGIYYISTCWDNVGNVYGGSDNSTWHAFSPPGANQATTPAVASIQVAGATTPPVIGGISISNETVIIHFSSGTSDPASAFTLFSAGVVNGTYSQAIGATITGSGGTYQATVAVAVGPQFYRIRR
jgi:hypothetical protein